MRSLSGAEQLENRSLMAGDVFSGYWNPAWPTDVNVDRSVDPQDVLTVVDSLSRNGMGALSPAATVAPADGSSGESQAPANHSFVDVDRDGELSPADVLWVLNAMDPKPEGAGELVKFRVAAVAVGTPNTTGEAIDTLNSDQQFFHPGNGGATNPGTKKATTLTEDASINGIAVIDKGAAFELRFYVQDIKDPNSLGVFSGYFDVDYDASKAAPVVNEIQAIQLDTTTDFTGGSFTITYNNQTVTVNPVFSSGVMNNQANATPAAIKTALTPIIPGGASSFDVVWVAPTGSASKYRWEIRFKGQLENQNLNAVVVNADNMVGGTNVQEVVDEFDGGFTGVTTDTTAFRRAFVPTTARIADPVDTNIVGTAYTSLVASADSLTANVMNEIGTIGNTGGLRPGTIEREYLRVKMVAVEATAPGSPMQFVLSPADLASSKTLIYGFPGDVIDPLTEIDYGAAFQLIVREYVSANADLYTTQNATVVAGNTYSLNVTANDTSLNSLPFQVVSTTAGSMGGTITVGAGNQSIQYTPASGFQIAPQGASGPNVQTETFVYTIAATDSNLASQTAYRDTATVTVNLIVPNIPPVNSAPGSVQFNEGGSFTFTGANTISVTDADNNGSTNIQTTLQVNSGTLTLVNTTGVSGNGTDTVVITGLPSVVNAALADFVYSPPAGGNFNGSVNLQIFTTDNGSGVGLPATDSDNVAITVVAVNDAPTQTLPGSGLETTDEDNLAVPGISVADVDLGEGNGSHTVTTTVAVANGSFGTLAVTPAGSAITSGINSAAVTITGSLADVNNTLATLIYKPQLNAVAVMTIDVTTSDNGNSPAPAQTATGSFDINVKAKARPKAIDDTPANGVNYTFAEETTTIANLSPSVLANDQIHDGSTAFLQTNAISNVTLNFAAALGGGTQAAPAGLIVQNGNDIEFNGTFLPVDFFGTITFDYLMDDAFTPDEPGADYTGRVEIAITNVNDAPVAVTDPLQTVAEEGQIAINVVSNDTDADNDTLTAEIVNNPANGALTIAAGVVTYKPNADYFGPDSFTYRANDGTTTSTQLVTVNIDVTAVNDAPDATDFPVSTAEGAAVNIDFTGRVTDRDSAVNLGSIAITGGPAHGTLTQNGDNTWTYTPNNPTVDYHGTDSFTYTATDGSATSTVRTVSLTITPVNDAPGATDDVMQTGEGQTMDFDVLANDYDVDASATFIPVDGTLTAGTTISIVTGPAHGSASVVTVGTKQFIRYTPTPATYNGPDSIVYRLTDNDATTPGSLSSNDATVNIDVLPKNDPPVAVADPGIVVNEDNTVSIDVFANDSDPDTASTQWSFVPVTQPAHGSISFNTTTRRVEYTPAANYAGPDSFSYKINDNSPIAPTNLESNTVAVSITVNEVNDPLVFNTIQPGIVIANGNIDYVNEIPILSFVSSGVDDPALDQPFKILTAGASLAGVSAAGGTLTITPNGTILYKAPVGMKDFNDSFTVVVVARNGLGLTASQTVNFFVQEAVPFNLRLNVFADASPNGVKDSFEIGLAGIPFQITGVDFRGQAVSLPVQYTDRNGQLNLLNLFPGTYLIQQYQSNLIRDGQSSYNVNDPRIARLSEALDIYQVTVGILPPPGLTPDVTINFGEGAGASAQSQAYAQSSIVGARPYANHIVSNTAAGAMIGTNADGTSFMALMQGWANVEKMELTNVNITSAYEGTAILNVYAVGSNTPVQVQIYLNQPTGFSIIGGLQDGSRMYRLNATAQQLGMTQFVPAGSGESFTSGADAFFDDLGA